MGGEIDPEALANIQRIESFDLIPDGTPVYPAHRNGSYDLFRGSERITDTDRDLRHPIYLDERETVLALADEGGSEMYDLVEVDLETGAITTVLDDEHMNQHPVQSPTRSDVVGFLSSRDGGLDLYQIHLDSGDIEELAAPDRPVHTFDWAPDGGRVVYQEGLYDQTRICIAEGGEREPLLDFDDSEEKFSKPISPAKASFWSERGILFSSNVNGYADIGVADASGEYEWLVTSDRDKRPAGWSPDGERFAYFEARTGANLVKVHDGSESRTIAGEGFGLRVRWHPDGSPAVLRFDYDSRGEIWHDGEAVVTEGRAEAQLTEPSVVRYESFDGRSIPGLLLEGDGEGAIIWAHGGPEWRVMRVLNLYRQLLADQGYTLLSVDVRGSTGYGREYRKLSDGDLGGDDLRDLTAAADYLRSRGHDRVGIMGGSYGGYMTLMSLIETDKFDAGVDIAGVSSMRTLLERTQGYLQAVLSRKMGGTPEERPDLYDERSPKKRANEISAPLLVIHGANDPRVPPEEAEQIVEAVDERGVPTEYLLFEDEGHMIEKSENKIDAYEQTRTFFDQHLEQ